MSENRIEGAFQNVAGMVKDAIGDLPGEAMTQAEDKARQIAGKVQSAYGEAADHASDLAANVSRSVEQRPLTALLIAGVAGYMLGSLMRRH